MKLKLQIDGEALKGDGEDRAVYLLGVRGDRGLMCNQDVRHGCRTIGTSQG
jgi:hypothetical protein